VAEEHSSDLAKVIEDWAGGTEVGTGAEPAESPRRLTRWQEFQIYLATAVGYVAVLLIGRSLRWTIQGWESFEAALGTGKPPIFTFWHREIFSATWFWRRRGIVVMTSQNFDGEYIARIIQRYGYGAARGSSSRGATRALKAMIRVMRRGRPTAFTIDGPRGPRYVAKPGAVLLAKATGAPIICFHIAVRHAYTFRRSWDWFQIPYPFSAVAIFIAPPILVSRDSEEEKQAEKVAEVQAALDGLVRRGERWLKRSKGEPGA
jgi:lysophospholipid acyltransferase (LPLAT)-like uncharacterized protein